MTLDTNVQSGFLAVATEIKADRTKVGPLTSLSTTAKTSIVAAINEVLGVAQAGGGGGGAVINDTTPSLTTTYSGTKIEAEITEAINGLLDGAPAALDTLNELAAALGDDPAFVTTITTALSNRVRTDTATQGLNTTQQSNARTNIAAASSTHGHALTDAGITGTLAITKGGTGATTAEAALTNLGAASAAEIGATNTNYATLFANGLS